MFYGIQRYGTSPDDQYSKVKKINSPPRDPQIINYNSGNDDVYDIRFICSKYAVGEQVRTSDHRIPFASIVKGPYLHNESDRSPSYTVTDGSGSLYELSINDIGGLPADRFECLKMFKEAGQNYPLIALEDLRDKSVRYVPIGDAIDLIVNDKLLNSDKPQIKLAHGVSSETRKFVQEAINALSKKADETAVIYPAHRDYRRLSDDEVSILHAAASRV